MIIANQKRKENIAEYILYMFQVEDIIRAYSFDINLIENNVINQFDQPYHVKREIREWYSCLIYEMKYNNLRIKGHIPGLRSLIDDLDLFHKRLLQDPDDWQYRQLYLKARPGIEKLRERSGSPIINEIEVCFNGLYGLLILRLKKKTINPETVQSFGLISDMMALLSSKYLDHEKKKA